MLSNFVLRSLWVRRAHRAPPCLLGSFTHLSFPCAMILFKRSLWGLLVLFLASHQLYTKLSKASHYVLSHKVRVFIPPQVDLFDSANLGSVAPVIPIEQLLLQSRQLPLPTATGRCHCLGLYHSASFTLLLEKSYKSSFQNLDLVFV